ncbi:Ndufa9 protein [Capsaspora owczarzaki ATCC 30864]|uniref:Ndufa9 protein n=1 Tax=Capsaspora owczarzaki (strain ATCC 30864) TaxID=595528 RepID=A0A0D2UI36_CAPO3|nr:Ndufa9 protein [Capsaspora owczarzaki ATCC 30864]KJE94781.1 Ndufa9 protein [Capsaspora owczarzaki ATCC 30864]|eukprot:XP_004347048.1 Ndufa9 protein [Capsaspora owczarzaki ATCC 30864]
MLSSQGRLVAAKSSSVSSIAARALSTSIASASSSTPVKSAGVPLTRAGDDAVATHTLAKWSGGPVSRAGTGGRSSVSGVVATVFGSTGFIGRYLVNRLGRVGSQLILPYRGDEHAYRHLKPMGDLGQFSFPFYHLRDKDTVKRLVEHSNVVFNLVGQEFATRNFSLHDVHVTGAETIARACQEAGVGRLIHVSALNASTESRSPFLQSKALGEQAVLAAFPNATIIRPATLFGPEDRLFNRLSVPMRTPFGVPLQNYGETRKQPIYVVDVARALIRAMEERTTAGKTFELVGPKEYTTAQLLQYMCDMARRPMRAFHVPSEIAE